MRNAIQSATLTCASTLLFFSAAAHAHHGWSGNTESIELTGTVVTQVDLSGPHATMQIEDTDGQVWDLTLAPAPRTARAGLTESVVPIGAEVTISGQRNDDPARLEVKTRRVTYNGTHFDVYPSG